VVRTSGIFVVYSFFVASSASATSALDTGAGPQGAIERLVLQIQRADYEGDRIALKRLYDELDPFADAKIPAGRVRYWRGFAMWRRAVNGFNDSVDQNELEQDLKEALEEFQAAITAAPTFVEAKIGMISCLGYLAFVHRTDTKLAQELVHQILSLVTEAKETAPNNPRLFWVLGPILWNTPAERGGGQDKAIENYKKGLELCSQIKPSTDPLEPSWGRPELLMNLAYSYLNKKAPDVDAAEQSARAALEIIPYWHYVHDILLAQILAAKSNASQTR
jgi:hypothetical protein